MNADEARERAALVKSANRLVNESVAGPLVEVADRGESIAEIPLGRVALKLGSGMIGHVYDEALADALEAAGHWGLALGVRKLVALGFNVAATIRGTDQPAPGGPHLESIRLSFAMAFEFDVRRFALPVLTGVVLPPAFQWRRRSAAVRERRELEDKLLALLAQEIERGRSHARLDLRQVAAHALAPDLAKRMAMSLRSRGFGVEIGASGEDLNVSWDA
jgi:hypothetical protein